MSTIQQTAEVNVTINAEDAKKELDDLKTQAKDLRQQYSECFKNQDFDGMNAAMKQLNSVNRQIEQLQTRGEYINDVMSRMDSASPRELNNVVRMVNRELQSGAVERGSEQWKILTKILRDAKEEYAKVRGEMSFQAPELTPQETLDKIDALQDKVKDLKQQYNDCFAKGDFAGMEAAKQELNEVSKELVDLRTNAQNIQAVMDDIDNASPKELQDVIRRINAEMESGLIEVGGQQWETYAKYADTAKKKLEEIREAMSFQAPELTPQETLDRIDALQDKVRDLKTAYNDCFAKGDFAGMEAAKQELSEVSKELVDLRTNAQNIQAVMDDLDNASPKELQDVIRRINAEMESGLIEVGGQQWETYAEYADVAKKKLEEVREAMNFQAPELSTKEINDKLEELQNKANDLKRTYNECFKNGDTAGMEKARKEIVDVNREMTGLRTNAQNIRHVMDNLDKATPKELHDTIKRINDEMESGAVERGSKQWDDYCEQLKQVKEELEGINGEMEVKESWLDKLRKKFDDWGELLLTGAAALTGVVVAGKAAVQAYADMDSALADTEKYTGMTREEVELLNEEFKKLDTRTSREELNDLASAAGRLGKNTDESVMEFVRAGNIIKVAMDEIGEDAPQTISQLAGIFELEDKMGTERSMLAVGSAINTLSQNCAASAPSLVDFAARMGAVAKQTGMTVDEMLAFGALIDDQMVTAEIASTAVKEMITKMYADSDNFAKKAGLDIEEFNKALKRSSTDGLMMFVGALERMNTNQIAATLKDLGASGAGVTTTFMTLAGKAGLLETRMKEAKESFREATSATEEFNVQNNTVQAGFDKAKKSFDELIVDLGSKLEPVMKYAISGTSLLMRAIATLVNFVIDYKGAIITTVAAMAAYTIAIKASTIAFRAHYAAIVADELITKTLTAGKYLLAAAIHLCTGRITDARIAWIFFNDTIKLSPIGLLVGGVTALATGIYFLTRKTDAATEALKQINKVENDAAVEARKQTAETDRLYKKTQDLTVSYTKRMDAIKELRKKIPDVLKDLSDEEIFAGKAAAAYDRYKESVLNAAKAKGYQGMIEENAEKQAKMEVERGKVLSELRKKTHVPNAVKEIVMGEPRSEKETYEALNAWLTEKSQGKNNTIANTYNPGGLTNNAKLGESTAIAYVKKLMSMTEEIEKIEKVNESITERLESVTTKTPEVEENPDGNGTGGTGGTGTGTMAEDDMKKLEAERKKREKEEKEAFRKRLTDLKANYDMEQAQNLAAYATGSKFYLEYLKTKKDLDSSYLADRKKVYEDADKTDSSEYAALLKEEADTVLKAVSETRKNALERIERNHKQTVEKLTDDLFNPSSKNYGNQQLYYQAMFEEDVKYLTKKRDLYRLGTEERKAAELEIEKRMEEDRDHKREEMAKAYEWFVQEIRKGSVQKQIDMELQMLKQLHNAKLITEQQYQDAVEKIRKKGREQEKQENEERKKSIEGDHEEAKRIMANSTDNFGNAAIQIHETWQKLMDDIANGENPFENLGKLAQESMAVVATIVSQYTNYANAQRDIEIAKVEERYDREIEAAGKNSKKKEKLEKQKEEEIAKLKKKYNDRAMKMQIAQALAQTAINAILGYQAGLTMPPPANVFMPPVLAGLAVAQGAIQVATIKKQHEAQSAGYYEGGFTGGNRYRKEAGVVHEGEFIANHKAVNNPELSPLFRMIDFAQRNNTVASLTAEDVSIALGQGSGVSARGEVVHQTECPVNVVQNNIDTTPIDRLANILEDGIVADVILDGERGLHKKYTSYQQLLKNPRR